MILVDTSVWIDHFRVGNSDLSKALAMKLVLTHPFVIGEITYSHLRNRIRILADLNTLPSVVNATHEEGCV